MHSFTVSPISDSCWVNMFHLTNWVKGVKHNCRGILLGSIANETAVTKLYKIVHPILYHCRVEIAFTMYIAVHAHLVNTIVCVLHVIACDNV